MTLFFGLYVPFLCSGQCNIVNEECIIDWIITPTEEQNQDGSAECIDENEEGCCEVSVTFNGLSETCNCNTVVQVQREWSYSNELIQIATWIQEINNVNWIPNFDFLTTIVPGVPATVIGSGETITFDVVSGWEYADVTISVTLDSDGDGIGDCSVQETETGYFVCY